MMEREETGSPSAIKGRILVADDLPDAGDSLKMLLELKGYEVWLARNGADALRIAEEHRPDVALLDIGMPVLNGCDAARRIRQEPWGRSITLIAITGWCQEDDIERCREAGFDRYLTKPIDLALLDQWIAAACARTKPRVGDPQAEE